MQILTGYFMPKCNRIPPFLPRRGYWRPADASAFTQSSLNTPSNSGNFDAFITALNSLPPVTGVSLPK